MADGTLGVPSARFTSKKSFEYKMSKKVAELTQVVHMLFSRNHEREVELESTKEAYEHEIVNVIADARKRIDALEQLLVEEKRKAEVNATRIQNDCERKLHEQQKETQKHSAEFKSKSEELIAENSSLKSDLSKIQEELNEAKLSERNQSTSGIKQSQSDPVEQLYSSRGEEISSDKSTATKDTSLSNAKLSANTDSADLSNLQENLRVKEMETETLKHLVVMHVKTQRESDVALAQLKKDLDKTESELRERIAQLIDDVSEAKRTKEKVQLKNKSLEVDLKNRRKVMERKGDATSDVSKGHSNELKSPKTTRPLSDEAQEEIERLKREIKWYRMELSNREGNFNRMFADSNPIRLGAGVGGLTLAPTRQKTDVPINIPHTGAPRSHSEDLRGKMGSPPNRLPTLGMDGRQRTMVRNRQGHNSGGAKGSTTKEKHTPRSVTSVYH